MNLKICTFNDSHDNAGAISLTFDDGWSSDYEIAFPLLMKYKIRATFFITSSWVGKPGYVSWTQLQEMQAAGMSIGSHSVSHPYLTMINPIKLKDELINSKKMIEDKLSIEVLAFSFPHGDYNKSVLNATFKAGYRYIATSVPGLNKNVIDGIYHRNSINSSHCISDIESLIRPNRMTVYYRQVNYRLRHELKRIIGVNNYLKLRNIIIYQNNISK